MSLRAGLARLGTAAVGLICLLSATVMFSPSASAATITQALPTSGSVDVADSAGFTDQLSVTGNVGAVTFTTTAANANVIVSSSGAINVSGGPLAVGTYPVSGTDVDTNSDAGTWSYSLTVTASNLAQAAPTSGSVTVANSGSFNDQLSVTGNVGAVTFTTTAANANVIVSSSGAISVSGGPLAVGTYTVSGTDVDTDGDTGTWSYSLTVSSNVITQASPTSGFVTTANSAAFSTSLNAAAGFIGPVTFTTSNPNFAVVNGDILESTGPLGVAGSPYVVGGTDSDTYGDSGSWTYSLAVGAEGTKSTILQTSSKTGTVSRAMSGSFTSGPIAVENDVGPVTFVTSQSNPALIVSASGLISSTGQLPIGTYLVSGTDSDAQSDAGTWSYTLTVTGVTVTVTFNANGGTGSMAAQSNSEPTALPVNTFTRENHTFVDWNTAANGSGVGYANGAILPFSSPTTLYAQWKAGKSPARRITFSSNGGVGVMPSEIDDAATAITANRFTRAGYTFVDWSSSAKGSGARFAAGATYAFKKSVTLYAQWKKIPKTPSHQVTFFANGGKGATVVERASKAASLTLNHFTRKGFVFVKWSTKSNGQGASYANGAPYSFTASTTLYAQWKKAPQAPSHSVTFYANGGSGSMAAETNNKAKSLTNNQFTRSGYRFAGWNTQANGLGVSYANGAGYSFDASVTLYAQWQPANAMEVTAGPFGHGASTLSSTLDSHIQGMANDVKSKNYAKISLVGYGDRLMPSQLSDGSAVAANSALGRRRAQSVAEYLASRLAALGATGFSISISGTGVVGPSSGGAASVVGTLS